jgi:D-alanyl-D-alanine carboxypeptidase
MDKPAPHCSAQSWAIFDQKANAMLFGKNEKDRREVASLTKIMTCYCVFKLSERFGIKDDTLLEISEYASQVIGTSAELLEGDTLMI